MDWSPFPSLAVPGMPDEPPDTVPRVPSGTELDLSWEVMTSPWFTGAGCSPTWEGRMLWQSQDVPPQHGLGQGCGTGDKPRGCWAAGDDLAPGNSLP